MSDEKKKVLVIENEPTILEMYQIKFSSSEFEFIGASTGEQGIEKARKQKPDVVLVDLILRNKLEGGHVDGLSVVQELKKNKQTKNIPVYALTNLNQESDIKRAMDYGADGFLVKSDLTPQQLLDNIKKMFNGESIGIAASK